MVTLLAVLLAVLLGCAQSREFALANRLEKAHQYQQALAAYRSSLAHTDAHDRHALSLTYYRMGECLIRLERMPDAFHAFQQSTEADPGNAAAHVRLGEFMVAAGMPNAARVQAEVAMRSDPGNGEAMALLGAALEKLDDKQGAIEAYRKALARDPRQTAVAIALAGIYNQDDNGKEAARVLEASAKANPQLAAPLLALGRLHEENGEIGEAETAYRAAVRAEDTRETNLRLAQFLQRIARISEAEQVLRRVDAMRLGKSTALADFELIAGRPASALQQYQATLQQSKPKAGAGMDSDRARLATRVVEADLELAANAQAGQQLPALRLAHAHLRQYAGELDRATLDILQSEIAAAENDLPVASAKAEEAVALAPESAAAQYVAGIVRMRCSDPQGARDRWMKALAADPQFAPARVALAQAALAEGDAEGARHLVTAVVREEPGNTRALQAFARALLAERRYASAASIAARIEALDPKSTEPQLLMGDIALAAQRPGAALLHYEHAILLDPRSPQAVESLIRLYRTGKITRPILLKIEKVAATKPQSAVLMEIAGRLFAERNWYADAERCLREALQIDPQRTTAAAALAETFAATGDIRAATDSAARTGGNAATLVAAIRAQEDHDVPAAIQEYERAVRGGDNSGVAANNLAWLYAEQGTNLGRALELAQTAQSLSPGNPAVLDTVGVVYLARREYSQAIKSLEAARSIARRSGNPEQVSTQIRRHLAEAYRKAGRTQAARAMASEVVPNHP